MLDRPYERIVLGLFGGQAPFVRETGIPQTTVSGWSRKPAGIIPHWHHPHIVDVAQRLGLKINPTDFVALPRKRKRSAA